MFTHMARPHQDIKAAALRASGSLHPNPDKVQDEAFRKHEFFDPRDRVQVKYEMLRRHNIDGRPITEVSRSFGVSRQAFYKTVAGFRSLGIPGLLPRRRGPKHPSKLTDAILDFIEQRRSIEPTDGRSEQQAIRDKFGISIHPRTVDRALARCKKKRRIKRKGRP